MLALQISPDADGCLSKVAVDAAAAHLLEAVERASDPRLMAYIKLRAVRDAYDVALAALAEDAAAEAQAYHRDDRHLMGVTFEISQSGRYSYAHDAECARLEAQLKARQEQMQALCRHGLAAGVDDNGAELLAAQYTPSRASLRLTFSKF